jgi:hypothetical protein
MHADPKTALRERLLRRLIWKVPLIFLLMFFAVWWQMRNESERELPTATPEQAALFTGAWQGEVKYAWGDRYTEQFFFQPERGKLFGTASFRGRKRGIEQGAIIGDTITFSVGFEEISGAAARLRRYRYQGKLHGDAIRLSIIDDQGAIVAEPVLRRSGLQP